MGGPAETEDMDARLTAMRILEHRAIVGIKVAHYNGGDWNWSIAPSRPAPTPRCR
jgi:hypothetical protein